MFSPGGMGCRDGGRGQFCWEYPTSGNHSRANKLNAKWRRNILRKSLTLPEGDAKKKVMVLSPEISDCGGLVAALGLDFYVYVHQGDGGGGYAGDAAGVSDGVGSDFG